ncbi:MAG: rRNA pseudouridine synthase [Lachnospiraceae bacterium]|nr:rRNA pseudouridine synthase [Lachnospiraceae bacterium]
MRLDRFLSEAGLGSRSQVKKILKDNKVRVNGSFVQDGKFQVNPESDEVFVGNDRILYQQYEYYLLNKPKGCVCANSDGKYPTVFDYVPMNAKKDLFTVGRLDLDTEGLLIITNDGAFSHSIMSPKKHVDKTYLALWDKEATADDVESFQLGMDIGDEKTTKPAKLSCDEKSPRDVYITISEGRYHQVKRMSAKVGKEVLELKRLQVGKFVLDGNLKPGEYRKFTKEELGYVEQYKGGSV